ncbi:phosphatase PAP2 family protein [Streptomyces sp. NPDC001262]|uniref:phosphatase PAP2 family protein n=1 Tax=unclassified Streptomyces TaxID=2593676 RepID=UPI0036D19FB3
MLSNSSEFPGPEGSGRPWCRDPRSRPVRAAACALSFLGEHAGVWIAVGAVGAVLQPGRRHEWAAAVARVGAAHLGSSAVKQVVRRPRPAASRAVRGTWSFPSSHSASSAAAAVAFRGLLPAPAVAAVAGGVMWSRLALRAHHPSDVIAGALLGTLVGGAGRPRGRDRR